MRVAITTTEDRFGAIASHFVERGLRPIPLSCIRVLPEPSDVLESVRNTIASVGTVMVSSSRAVEVLWPDGGQVQADFFAVGSATAAAVVQRGATVRWEGSGGLGDLSRAMVPFGPERVVFPHADGTHLDSLEPLMSTGVDVLSSVVYRTDRCPPADDEVDAVAFASPTAVDGWLSTRSLDGLVVAAIGPTTAAALVRRGIRVDVVPFRPGHADLAVSLAALPNGRTP